MFRGLACFASFLALVTVVGGQTPTASQRDPIYFVCSSMHPDKCATPPKLVSRTDPKYTPEAREKRIQGKVVLAVVILANGEPSDVKVAKSLGAGLDAEAVTSVKNWRFEPARYQGKPVPVRINVEVNFRLYDKPGTGSIAAGAGENDGTEPEATSTPNEKELEREYRQAYTAYEQRDYAASIKLAKHVAEELPSFVSTWNLLGMNYLAVGELDAAESALKRAIELNPRDVYAHNNLGRVYQAQRRFEDAAGEFRRQIEINPDDRYASFNLGLTLHALKRYREAIPVLQKAAELTPKNPIIPMSIGRSQMALGEKENALKSFESALSLGTSPDLWNGIAWELAKNDMELGRAEQYAQLAVSAAAAMMQGLSIEHPELSQFARTRGISSFWDTLAYVSYKKGDLDKARSYVEAAWALSPNAEIGEHRGEIYEKLGRREEAIGAYATSLALREDPAKEMPDENSAFEESIKRLKALVPEEDRRKEAIAAALKQWKSGNVVKVANTGKLSGTTEIAILLKGDKTVQARALRPEDPQSENVKSVTSWNISQPLPSGASVDLVRRGTLSCPAGAPECELTLMSAQDAARKPLGNVKVATVSTLTSTPTSNPPLTTRPEKQSNLVGREYASETMGIRITVPEGWTLMTEVAPDSTRPAVAIFGKSGALAALVLTRQHLEATDEMYSKLIESQMRAREGFERMSQASVTRDKLPGTRWTLRWIEKNIAYRGVMEFLTSRDEHFSIFYGAPEEMFERYTAELNDAIRSVQFPALHVTAKDLP